MDDTDQSATIALRPADPYALLATALEKGVGPDVLEKFMDLQERHEQRIASKAFAAAITKFQSIVHSVFKRRTATVQGRDESKRGYSYSFASFDDIMLQIGPALAECGIAVTFNTSVVPDKVGFLEVICFVRHGIHVEKSSYTLPIPAMTVNDTQRFGAAVSYGKRYAIIAALNLVVTDQDDDGAGLADVISESMAEDIRELLFLKGINLKQFLGFLQIEAVEHLNSRDYNRAVDYLRRKRTVRTAEEWEAEKKKAR